MGLGLSMLIRVNLMEPYYKLISPEVYNYVVTYHGLVMIFFFLMPVLIGGFGNYFIPLFCCMRDLSFPRMNRLSLWLMFPSLVMLELSMFYGAGVG